MERIQNEILANLENDFTLEQLKKVNVEICKVLNRYNFTLKSTEVVTKDNTCEMDIKEFTTRKHIEGLSDKTIKSYLLAIKQFIKFYGTNLREVKEYDIIAYFDYLERVKKNKKSSIENNRIFLRPFFKYLTNTDKILKNPMENIKKIKYQKSQRIPLTGIEMQKIFAQCKKDRYRAIVSILASSGLRVAEIVNLDISDLDFKEQIINVRNGKGGKSRVTMFDSASAYYLERYLVSRKDGNPAVFVSQKKPYQRIGIRYIEDIISHIGKESEINRPIFPYIYRHTFVTQEIAHGMPIQIVSEMMNPLKNLKPFEDAIGKFFVCKDENCEPDEWFSLYVEEDNERGRE